MTWPQLTEVTRGRRLSALLAIMVTLGTETVQMLVGGDQRIDIPDVVISVPQPSHHMHILHISYGLIMLWCGMHLVSSSHPTHFLIVPCVLAQPHHVYGYRVVDCIAKPGFMMTPCQIYLLIDIVVCFLTRHTTYLLRIERRIHKCFKVDPSMHNVPVIKHLDINRLE